MIARRSFLKGMLAVCAAPAIVRASNLMPIVVPSQALLTDIDYLPAQEFSIDDRDFTFEFWVTPDLNDLALARPTPKFGALCQETTKNRLLTFDGTRWVAVQP